MLKCTRLNRDPIEDRSERKIAASITLFGRIMLTHGSHTGAL